MRVDEIEVNFVRDGYGQIRLDYTEEELLRIPENRRERFVELADAAHEAHDAKRAWDKANDDVLSAKKLADNLIAAKQKEYPPMTQHQAYIAHLKAIGAIPE